MAEDSHFLTAATGQMGYLWRLMQFLHPEILWALTATAIPVIVHLFNFRKFRRVLFPNVAFLQEIKQQTQSKSQLRHLLILLSRILAVVALVLAFAQPFIPREGSQVTEEQRAISLYIDNSFSMEAESKDGRLLELAKNKALEIVDVYSATDQFQILTGDFEGRHQRLVSQEEAIEWIEEVRTSPQARPLSEVLMRQTDALERASTSNRTRFVLSDLQVSTHDFENIVPDSTMRVHLVPGSVENPANLSIDSVWFETPVRQLNQSERLSIRIRNSGKAPVENVSFRLEINGTQKALGSFAVDAEATVDTALFYSHATPGLKSAVVTLEDHPVVFDDAVFFSYNVAQDIDVLELRGPNATSSLRKIFEEDPYYDFTSVSHTQVDYAELPGQNLVLLNELNAISSGLASALLDFVRNGGSLAVVPAESVDRASYNTFLSGLQIAGINAVENRNIKVSDINLEHPLYSDIFEHIPDNVDLPSASKWLSRSPIASSGEDALLTLQNGQPFLSRVGLGEGSVYVFAAALQPEASSFAQHAFFVTSALRMAEFSQAAPALYHTIGEHSEVALKGIPQATEQPYRLQHLASNTEIMPEHRTIGARTELFPRAQDLQAGNYHVHLGGEPLAGVSFNYSRSESELDAFDNAGLLETLEANRLTQFDLLDGSLETLRKQVEELDSGFQLWYSFIILALIFLAIEILLIKFWPR